MRRPAVAHKHKSETEAAHKDKSQTVVAHKHKSVTPVAHNHQPEIVETKARKPVEQARPAMSNANRERELILYLRDCFVEVDSNKDGIISRQEFSQYTAKESFYTRIAELGVKLPVSALGKAWDLLDLDGDNTLQMDEFVVGFSYMQDALTPDDRKQRFAIDAILKRQQSIRTSISLFSGKVLLAALSAVGMAGVAAYTGFLPAWYATGIPAGASALMLSTSVAETSGTWSKGSSRYSAAQALEQGFRGEIVLAEAQIDKAFIPFGVGLTGIAAAACSGLKFLAEQEQNFLDEKLLGSSFLDVGDILVVLLALAAVFGASLTSDQSLRMRTTLRSADQEELFSDRTRGGNSRFWLKRAMQPVGEPPDFQERAVNAITTLLLCLLPLPLVDVVREAPDTPSLVVVAAVVVAEVAAALAAVTFVLAEKDFANVERRIVLQCKNAALAELFYSQTLAEAAVLPASSALSGAALGGATAFVEFSGLLAAVTPWSAGLAALRSSVGAAMAHLEARAAWLQRGLSMRSTRQLGDIDVVASSLRELRRAFNELKEDPLSDKTRDELQRLPVGDTKEFEALDRGERRKVHLVAADMGMSSQSVDREAGRVVRVTNLGSRPTPDDSLGQALRGIQREFTELFEKGVPPDSRSAFTAAAVAGLGGAVLPTIAGPLVAGLTTPVVTAGVALLTVQQERAGDVSAATAQRYSSGMAQLLADANSLIGRAYMVHSMLPTAFAVATFAAVVSVVGFAGPFGLVLSATHFGVPGLLLYLLDFPALAVSLGAFAVSVWRLRRIIELIKRATSLLQAEAPPCMTAKRWYVWPMLAATAFLFPVDVCRKVSIASAVLMGGTGVVFAAGAVQVARGDNFVARTAQICACADGWAQRSAKSIRLLPFESAAAVVTALLAAALGSVSIPVAASFPLAGTAICLRAMQLQDAATLGANEAQLASESLQVLSCSWPWKPKEAEVVETPINFDPLPTLPAWRILLQRFRGDNKPFQMSAGLDGLLGRGVKKIKSAVAEGSGPEKEFEIDAAERAVQNVQRELDELYSTRSSRSRGTSGTFKIIGGFTAFCLFVPVLFYGSAAVILPVAGAGLTLFTAIEECTARMQVNEAKIRAAEINSVAATCEVLVSATAPYRARLIVATCITCFSGVAALALEHAAAHSVVLGGFERLMVLAHALAAAWCAWPLNAVCHWSERVRQAASSLSGKSLEAMGLGPGTSACGGAAFGTTRIPLPPRRRLWPLLFALPGTVLAWLPHGKSFAQCAVASTAASAGVVAAALFAAEVVAARAERILATRQSTFALTDAFANEGEQQTVLLPLVSSASIAVSALIAFLVEVNPWSAAALTVLQTSAWVLAARKGIAAKYYSRGAMQVDSVTERPSVTQR